MFYDFPIEYNEPVYRPPSEGRSLLIQVTIGCSNNKCTYCDMYRSKKYRERELADIISDIEKAHQYFSKFNQFPKKIFLCDGDALGAPMSLLIPVLEKINQLFPLIDRIGIYATAENMLDKTTEELKILSEMKLNIAYLGLESGNDKILHMIVKGNTASEMIEGSLKVKESGFKLSTIAMLGVGGKKYSDVHVRDTIDIVSKTSPEYFSFLTTMAKPGTPYYRMVERGLIEQLTSKELLIEMRDILKEIKPTNDILFRANHVSNQYPLGGTLPHDTNKITEILSEWILTTPENQYPPMPWNM